MGKKQTASAASSPAAMITAKRSGIEMNRKCRDVIFLLLFVLYWAGMFVVAQSGISNGDIRQLQYTLLMLESQKIIWVISVDSIM
jgi:hypothetical protein